MLSGHHMYQNTPKYRVLRGAINIMNLCNEKRSHELIRLELGHISVAEK